MAVFSPIRLLLLATLALTLIDLTSAALKCVVCKTEDDDEPDEIDEGPGPVGRSSKMSGRMADNLFRGSHAEGRSIHIKKKVRVDCTKAPEPVECDGLCFSAFTKITLVDDKGKEKGDFETVSRDCASKEDVKEMKLKRNDCKDVSSELPSDPEVKKSKIYAWTCDKSNCNQDLPPKGAKKCGDKGSEKDKDSGSGSLSGGWGMIVALGLGTGLLF